jgi:small subunit ribosomal protein S1
MSWSHVNHPRDLLKVGEEVEVKVISIDRERKRIGLSMKSLENDPWLEVIQGYQEDQLVQGKITKLTRFGAFASLMDNREVEGLIHVSELADYRVEHPRDVVAVGDVLTLRVLKIDLDRRRLGLSLKRANSAKYMSSDWDSWGPGSDD